MASEERRKGRHTAGGGRRLEGRPVISYSITISSNFDVNDLLALHYAINTATPSLPTVRKVWTRAHEWQRLIEAASGRGGARCMLYLVPSDREKSTTKSYTTRGGTKPTAAAATVAGCNNETRTLRGRDGAREEGVGGGERHPILSARGTVNTRGVIITGAPGLTETRGDEGRDRSSIGLDVRRWEGRGRGRGGVRERERLDVLHSRISYVRRIRNCFSRWRG